MKLLLQRLLTLWTRIYLLCFRGHVIITRGLCFLIHWNNQGKDNVIHCLGGRLSNARIIMIGDSNQIVVRGEMTHVSFQIEGNNNLIEVCENSRILKSSFVARGNHCRIIIGKNTVIFGMMAVAQGQDNDITIGKDCLFSTNIDLWASDTHTIWDESGEICNHSRSIHIGDHVWIGKGVAVLKGCTIDNDSVVGMHSLVTSNIPSSVIAAGSPAKVIKSNIRWDKAYIDQKESII